MSDLFANLRSQKPAKKPRQKSPPNVSAELAKEIVRLYQEGFTQMKIARKFRINHGTVKYCLEQHKNSD